MSLALTRRQFLSSTAAVGIVGISAGPAQAAVIVHEITMATPDVICVEVRDPPVQYGQIIDTGAPITEGAAKVTKVVDNGTGLCRVTTAAPIFSDVNTGAGGVTGFHSIVGVPGANGTFSVQKVGTPGVNSDTVDLLGSTFSGAYVSGGYCVHFEKWIRHGPGYAAIIGPEMRHVRTADTRSTTYLNRAAADTAADYGRIGERAITKVYRKTSPYIDGETRGRAGSFTDKCTSSKHFLFLQLDNKLSPGGPYTINFPPGTGIAPASFSFDDRSTRALAIRCTQAGHRPTDVNKLAYLALWLPGGPNEGAVNFAEYGINKFEVIDSRGTAVFTGPLTLRIKPSEPEKNTGYLANQITGGFPASDGVQQVSSWSQAPIPIRNISNTNPGVLTTSIPHGLQNGELVRLWFTGHAGYDAMWRLNARTVRVKNTTATTFEMQEFEVANAWTDFDLRNPSPGYPGYGTYSRWPHGLLFKTVAINRAGTYVYGLDYSRWVAANPGAYRIRIPGLGVSDPIPVGDSAWYVTASGSAQGEYHHRSGIELDGRFGYSRPSCFNGDAIKIYESNLPYVASDLGGGPIPTQAGAAPPFIRTSTTTFGGSWADAGDWVQRVAGVSGACYNFCDLTELVPLAASSSAFNLPKSSTLLDPILYRGTDSLPDVVHQAIFGLDTYRRTQNEAGKTFGSGAVYGGLGMTTGTGVTPFEPSHLFRGISFTYAPDHFSTFAFAGAAAKIATTLAAYGFTSLSDVWKQSAIDAWNWANPIYLDASGEFDAYYIGLLQLKSNAGWNDTTYASFKSNVHNLSSDFRARSFASGCLYRLTGDNTYKTAFEKHWGPPNGFEMVGDQVLGAWEYQKRVGATAAIAADIRRRFVERADVSLVAYSQGHIAYRSIQFLNGSPFNWGSCGTDIGDTGGTLVRAHVISRNPKFLATLQSGLAFLYGANQMGMSFTAGVGVRWPQTLFNQDSLAMGVPTPAGISGYGFWILGCQAQAAIFQFGSGFFNWIVNYPDSRYTSDFEFERTEEPNNFALPIYEALHESHYVLNQMERSIQQTVLPLQFAALYLHGWDGNKAK